MPLLLNRISRRRRRRLRLSLLRDHKILYIFRAREIFTYTRMKESTLWASVLTNGWCRRGQVESERSDQTPKSLRIPRLLSRVPMRAELARDRKAPHTGWQANQTEEFYRAPRNLLEVTTRHKSRLNEHTFVLFYYYYRQHAVGSCCCLILNSRLGITFENFSAHTITLWLQ